MLVAFKEEEIKHLKDLFMTKVPATMNSDGSKDTQFRTKAQKLFVPGEALGIQYAILRTPTCLLFSRYIFARSQNDDE